MESLDDLDFHILRELIVGSGAYLRSDRVSMEAVARVVGVHRSTVADRIAKWGRIGFLTDWTSDVDPGALGLVGAHVHFQSRAQVRERALQLVSLVEGVEGILAFDQGWVGIIFMADSPDALTRTEKLLSGILEADRTARMVETAGGKPQPPLRLVFPPGRQRASRLRPRPPENPHPPPPQTHAPGRTVR